MPEHRSSGSIRDATVLIVDDDPTARLVVSAVLQSAKMRVLHASSGHKALEIARDESIDVVVLDLLMPGMDGFATTRRLRELPGHALTPIVIMTALEDTESVSSAFSAGATDFITKPLNFELLVQRLRYVLRMSEAVKQLDESRRRLTDAQRLARFGLWECEPGGSEIVVSDELLQLLGLDDSVYKRCGLDEFIGLIPSQERESVRELLGDALTSQRAFSTEHRVVDGQGEIRFVRHEGRFEVHDDQRCAHLVGVVQDISELRRSQERLAYIHRHDSLTGLANRRCFIDQLNRAIMSCQQRSRQVLVMLVDIDDFKRFNESLGHRAGDRLLCEIAERLGGAIRDEDLILRIGPGRSRGNGEEANALLARGGGDEFLLMLSTSEGESVAQRIADRVRVAFGQPFTIGDERYRVSASIGAAVFPFDGESGEALLRNAEFALNQAKLAGPAAHGEYRGRIEARGGGRLQVESRLLKALREKRVEVHYQPKIDVHDGLVSGVEALVRWTDESLGHVPPMEFVAVAERSELIFELGRYVTGRALADMARLWRETGRRLPVSVNLSPRQFHDPELCAFIENSVAQHGLRASALELEVTESVLVHDMEHSRQVLERLRRMGLHLALDDFGTGYSSLSYLRELPFSTIKLDRSFVSRICEDEQTLVITRAIVALGHALNLTVVAEGVELQKQLDLIKQMNCDQVQGWLYAQAMPYDDLRRWLNERADGPRASQAVVMRRQDCERGHFGDGRLGIAADLG
ncbi:MAG: EAL domain-containing protein [Gammaproteobacteria bacterium]|nr:EAL domain-containing protein [Gammaproteobacteria bacterium]